MNAPTSYQAQLALAQSAPAVVEEDSFDLTEYWDILVDRRWLVLAITILALLIGGAYVFVTPPVYQSNLVVQVEDSGGSAKNLLGESAPMFDVKTPASAEMEILRSRMVLGFALDNTMGYVDAAPRYLPLVGRGLARRATGLSEPGFLGMSAFDGYVTGRESIAVGAFDVPEDLQGTPFTLTAQGNGRFRLAHPMLATPMHGTVGAALRDTTPFGPLTLTVSSLNAKPGAEFDIVRRSWLATVEGLQASLKLSERGRQSGIIEASLEGEDPRWLKQLLGEIGRQYVRQNVERRAAEAQKTLGFLETQLPQFKQQLDRAEEAYNRYRNKQGTVALDEEAKLILTRTVDLQTKLLDAQQKRREFAARFTSDHPAVKTLDEQIQAWNHEIGSINTRVRGLPTIQQDALRLERDVKVTNELYAQLRNNALQLQLVKEGKIGNVRVIDDATRPEIPVRPSRVSILGIAGAIGLVAGALLALGQSALFRGVRSAQEIEDRTGLHVYSTIPLSNSQDGVIRRALQKRGGINLLAIQHPQDVAVESLRSLRTALQFAMLDASNNRLLITGATPNVGKSFVSCNLAVVLASAGKRVLLIDADMRKGYLHQNFGMPRERGLSEVIAGSLPLADAIHRGVVPQLDLLTTGVIPPNPAELLTSHAMETLLEQVSADYDLVVLDTPPVLAAADTLGIAVHAGTLLLVARAEETQLGELIESGKRLVDAGKAANGVLFNAVDSTRRHYGAYGYRYGGYKYRTYEYEAK